MVSVLWLLRRIASLGADICMRTWAAQGEMYISMVLIGFIVGGTTETGYRRHPSRYMAFEGRER